MSASREKKQRQNTTQEPLTKAQQEQAAYKSKVRKYTIIGVVVVVLVAALLIWNSGIFQKNATAATVDGTKISVSELGYYYYDIRYNYARYGLIDSNQSDKSQMYDKENNVTFQDFLLDSALSNAKETYTLYTEALANGHSDSEVKDSVAAQISEMKASAASNGYSYKSFLKAVYGRYMTPDAFEKMVTRELVANQYYNEVYTAKKDSFTADDLTGYYKENKDSVDSYTYSYLYFKADSVPTTGDDGEELDEDTVNGLKEAAAKAAHKKAEDALEKLSQGTSIADVIEACEPSSSADHTTVTGSSALNSVFRDDLLSADKDVPFVVDNSTSGTYVVVFHDRFLDENESVDVRHILFYADVAEGANAPTEEAWAAAKAEAEAALAEYQAGEQTAEAFGALAEKYSDDPGSNTNGGLYTGVTEGDFVTEFNDWLFGDDHRSAGDTALIRHEGSASTSYNGYHVAYFQGYGEANWQISVRSSLTGTAMNEWRDALLENVVCSLSSAASFIGE